VVIALVSVVVLMVITVLVSGGVEVVEGEGRWW
jgi:hypothetical protein